MKSSNSDGGKATFYSTKPFFYEERIPSGNQQTEFYFVRILEKIRIMEEYINQQIDKFMDLKEQMGVVIDELPNIDESLTLS
ncbi:hypothetical protein J9303_03145 [Bacillaceae bacterium Marseille-Q3522]|nr:hypothetical protein [Bacillaceae bacterium Marseille-Q3522]